MPKILRIHNRLIIGGPTLNVLNLTRYLAPEFETMLIVGEREHHEKDASYLAEQMGVKTIYIPDMGRSLHPLKDLKSYRQIQKIIRSYQPDIVHTHAAKPGAVGRLAASSTGHAAVVHTYHGHVFHSYFGKAKSNLIIRTERFLATKTDAIVAISDSQKKELVEEFKIANDGKFRVIPLGFELHKFITNAAEKRNMFRQEFGLHDDEIAVGIVGRLVPVKNHALFVDAIDFTRKHTLKKIRAFIVGDGETKKQILEKAKNLGISCSVPEHMDKNALLTFTSWRHDIDVVNAGMDIIALTSLNEGTPVSLIEAQAAGKPIVSTRVGGITDVVIENETALLSDTDQNELFANNLLKMVEDDSLRQRLGKKGVSQAFDKYSVERLVHDMGNLYRELLVKKNRKN